MACRPALVQGDLPERPARDVVDSVRGCRAPPAHRLRERLQPPAVASLDQAARDGRARRDWRRTRAPDAAAADREPAHRRRRRAARRPAGLPGPERHHRAGAAGNDSRRIRDRDQRRGARVHRGGLGDDGPHLRPRAGMAGLCHRPDRVVEGRRPLRHRRPTPGRDQQRPGHRRSRAVGDAAGRRGADDAHARRDAGGRSRHPPGAPADDAGAAGRDAVSRPRAADRVLPGAARAARRRARRPRRRAQHRGAPVCGMECAIRGPGQPRRRQPPRAGAAGECRLHADDGNSGAARPGARAGRGRAAADGGNGQPDAGGAVLRRRRPAWADRARAAAAPGALQPPDRHVPDRRRRSRHAEPRHHRSRAAGDLRAIHAGRPLGAPGRADRRRAGVRGVAGPRRDRGHRPGSAGHRRPQPRVGAQRLRLRGATLQPHAVRRLRGYWA